MKKITIKGFLLTLVFLFSMTSFAQSGKSIWKKTTKQNFSKEEKVIRKTEPKQANFYQLDLMSLKASLLNAPSRSENKLSDVIIEFPTINGANGSFRVMEASVMTPDFQAQHPELRSYVGQNVNNPSETIRFSVTPQGLHTMMFTNKGVQYIDPYTKTGNNYIVYAKQDLPALDNRFECGVVDEGVSSEELKSFDLEAAKNANDGQMRTFRLALACTIEYSAYHWAAAGLVAGDTEAAKRTAVQAAMVVTMTRVNGIYEKDFSITMTMVNNDSIVFINSDSFTDADASALINESQTVIDANITNAGYDIGHTFSTGGGGLAALNSPCVTGNKARGITGSTAPVGDAYDVDFVAHEMGHQFGGPHTFNGDGGTGNCGGGNRSGSNAYEPGGGTTIMAYAGICTANENIQSNSDAYFHRNSILRIWANVSAGNSTCGAQVATGNGMPTANAGGDYIIPMGTPYMLEGSSTDTETTTTHTYTWEQYDLGTASAIADNKPDGPIVRSFEGTTNPIRYIPRMQDILVNGGTSTTYEKLSTVNRDLNFQLTVRDNDVRGGQTDNDAMLVDVETTAGPFSVTSQPTQTEWVQNATETITWNVASTNTGTVNTPNVDILLSIDGGMTYPIALATAVPNDGSQDITVPNITELNCRIMVKGSGNIFFNVNAARVIIGYNVTTTCNTYASGALGTAIPDGTGANAPGAPIFHTIPVSGETGNVVISEMKFNVDVSHTWAGDVVAQLLAPDGTTFNNLWARDCNTGVNDFDVTFQEGAAAITCAEPTVGVYAPASSMASFNGQTKNGNWQLAVVDYYNGDTGTLNDWSIEICTETAILGVNDHTAFADFTVYPNPSSGLFTVNLSSNQDVKMSLFDVRGRNVYAEVHSNNSVTFNKEVDFSSMAAGIYLLNVESGSKKATKKIIIQ